MLDSFFNIETMTFDPLAPLGAIIALAAVGSVLVLFFLWKSPLSGLLRGLALAGLLLLLLNPQRLVGERTALTDIVVVLVDKSASQELGERTDATDRIINNLRTRIGALENTDVIETVIDGVEQTNIGAALANAFGDTPRARLSGVFIVTDGQSADTINPAATPDGIPVHIILTGERGERDRKLSLVNAPRYGLVNESVDVSFRIDDLTTDNKPLNEGPTQTSVTLRVNGEEILREQVPVGSEVEFAAPLDRPGRTIIELEAAPLNGELTERNNTAVLPISAIRDRLRVLLISGEPHPGERAWRNLLKSDPAIDLVHFTILRPIEKAQSDRALERELALIEFPQNELFIEKLSEFDLVIFDRYTYRGVLNAYHFDNIARYVENGGAVLVSSGPEFFGYLSLAASRNFSFILPVDPIAAVKEETFRPKLSDVGARHPVTRALPEQDIWGRWLRIMPVARRAGSILMEGPAAEPLLVLNRFGEGRVGVLTSDHVWLWARGFDGGGPHSELLRRVSHWLMKEPDLEEEQLTLTARGDDLLVERSTISDENPPVVLTYPDGRLETLKLAPTDLGRFAFTVENAPQGLYKARAGALFAVGAIGLAAPPEYTDVVSTAEKVSALRDQTGGGLFRVSDRTQTPNLRRISPRASQQSGANWAGLVRRNAARIDAMRSEPFASPYFWLSIIGLALLAAWWVEGRKR